MKQIKKYVKEIDEELESAMEYAEKYIEYKAHGESSLAAEFRQMAQDELKHAMNLHELAVKEIEAVKKVYTAPQDMQNAWNESHDFYIREYQHIKGMIE